MTPADLAKDRARALALTPVSRETSDRLDAFVALFLTWQPRINLVADSTLATLWTRHIADSLQLLPLIPQSPTIVDLGSGGGFPGLILACALADQPGAYVHLVESNGKKAGFLREARRITNAPADIHAIRIDKFAETFHGKVAVVTARALAPLGDLLSQSQRWLTSGATGLFLKGQHVVSELDDATRYWTFRSTLTASRTDPQGQIVSITALEPAASN